MKLRGLASLSALLFFLPAMAAEAPAICTEDAKLCADGSAVSRSGPHCSFAACPEEKIMYPVYEISPVVLWDTDNIMGSAEQRARTLRQEIRDLARQTHTPIWFHEYVNPVAGSWIQVECPPAFVDKIAALPDFGRANKVTFLTRRIPKMPAPATAEIVNPSPATSTTP